MGSRLPLMLKDAGLTAFVGAALGIFIVGFRTVDVGRGLTFDYHLVDLAVAVVVILEVDAARSKRSDAFE